MARVTCRLIKQGTGAKAEFEIGSAADVQAGDLTYVTWAPVTTNRSETDGLEITWKKSRFLAQIK